MKLHMAVYLWVPVGVEGLIENLLTFTDDLDPFPEV